MQLPPEQSRLKEILFPKKIGRVGYISRLLALLVTHFLVSSVLLHAEPMTRLRLILLMGWVAVMLLFFLCFVVTPRTRDFGLPTYAVALYFVPLLNILFLIALLLGPRAYWQYLRSPMKKEEVP